MPRKRQTRPKPRRPEADAPPAPDSDIRIIGGSFRGRRLQYHGDPLVRPMKHRVREAIFNLIGPAAAGSLAIDLFAGTGSLGLESLSRGAAAAILIEQHVPTSRVVAENIRSLAVDERATLLVTSAFVWAKRDLPQLAPQPTTPQPDAPTRAAPTRAAPTRAAPAERPWLLFCCPPYAFFTQRAEEMLDLIHRLQRCAPSESMLVVESDERFDFRLLEGEWDVRTYPPAVVGIWRKV